jgi:hypothetical protein
MKTRSLNLKMRCGAIHISTVELERCPANGNFEGRMFETMTHNGEYYEVPIESLPAVSRFTNEDEAVSWHNYMIRRAKSAQAGASK